jgi:hypothetical protein
MNVAVHPLHDVLGRRAGREDLLDAHLLELGRVFVGDDAAAEQRDVARAFFMCAPERMLSPTASTSSCTAASAIISGV